MQKSTKKILACIVIAIIILIAFFIFWLKPQDSSTTQNIQNSDQATSLTTPQNAENISAAQGANFSSASQQDIQVNCQIQMDNANRLIVNEATKNCFEFFITQFGEKDIQQIKSDFIGYAKTSYKEPLLSQLTDLWSRYMQYREQLGNLQAPNVEKDTANYYKAIFSSMQSLRKQFFSDYEIEGLFGTEDIYNDYTLERMTILENKKLSADEKAKQLKEKFEELPEDWKENLKQLNQLEDLRKLTSEIKARGGSADEIRQMRMNLVGPEATQRLETLDGQRSDWKNRVNGYLSERDNIMKSNMSDSAKQSAVQQLRQQHFNKPEEQLRIETFETVKDQGGKLPFGE